MLFPLDFHDPKRIQNYSSTGLVGSKAIFELEIGLLRGKTYYRAIVEAGDGSSDAKSPAERIFPATVLDAGYFVIEFLGQFASLAICHLEILAFETD